MCTHAKFPFKWLCKIFCGEEPSQYDYVEWWMKDIISESERLEQEVGPVLLTKLPQHMVNVLRGTSFDPYPIRQSIELYHWLDKHIFFGRDGVPMVLHDYGRLVWAGRHYNEAKWLDYRRYHYG